MKKILFVNSCVRENSRTYELAEYALSCLNGEIFQINIADENIMPLNRERLDRREKFIADENFGEKDFKYAKQFAESDEIVIAAPYWDLSFPALLKAYIEAICVCRITFCYNDLGIPEGLCKAKRLIYITTSGGIIGEFNFGFDYIKALAKGLFGINDVLFFSAENLDIYGNNPNEILNDSKEKIKIVLKNN